MCCLLEAVSRLHILHWVNQLTILNSKNYSLSGEDVQKSQNDTRWEDMDKVTSI